MRSPGTASDANQLRNRNTKGRGGLFGATEKRQAASRIGGARASSAQSQSEPASVTMSVRGGIVHAPTRTLKSLALRMLTSTWLAGLFRPLTQGAATIFMLHRFSDPERGVSGYDPSSVRALLCHLRRERYQLVDLATLFDSLNGHGPPLHGAVAFSIDDGYLEHATTAGPLFAEFDCPVTTFVTTGFLDGALWFWWDQIEYVFRHTTSARLALDGENGRLAYKLGDQARRRVAQEDLIARCKLLADPVKHAVIRELADAAQVPLPERAPAEYAPMTWDQLRASERRGMTFGPHTVTHPILSRASDAQARAEIVESWERLKAEANCPVPVFAYPNGQPADFGDREFGVLRDAGLIGAVTGVPGFATRQLFQAPSGPFLVPRFPFPDSLPYLVQQVGGLERLKFLLRGEG